MRYCADQKAQGARLAKGVVMRISRQGTVAALVVALSAVSATTASAATSPLGTTVTIGSPKLSPTRLFVTVPVNVSCSSSTFSTVSSENVAASVRQASGLKIATGFGVVNFSPPFSPTPLFPCDDTTHAVPVPVQADPSGAPYHGGLASASAQVCLGGTDSLGVFSVDCVIEGPDTVGIVGGGL